ncbi:MAG: hypothetical protein ACE1Y4_18820, partial [Lysobacterales bacterium]
AVVLAEKLRQSQPVWRQVPGSRVVKNNPQRMQAAATCVAVLKALLGGLKSLGTWTSPDRGIRTSTVS